MAPSSPSTFSTRQVLYAFEDLYLNAIRANQNQRYLSSLRVTAQETLVSSLGLERMRAVEMVNQSALVLEMAEERERTERWGE